MVGELITLPVRVGVRATRLWFRAVEATVSVTTSATGRVIELFASRSANGAGSTRLPHDGAPAEGGPSPSEGELRTSRDVHPPWDGYERMNAKQVIARLAKADPAELAAVQLYERSNRRRRTILAAVGRELRKATGSGPNSQQRERTDQRR